MYRFQLAVGVLGLLGTCSCFSYIYTYMYVHVHVYTRYMHIIWIMKVCLGSGYVYHCRFHHCWSGLFRFWISLSLLIGFVQVLDMFITADHVCLGSGYVYHCWSGFVQVLDMFITADWVCSGSGYVYHCWSGLFRFWIC